MMSQLDPEDDKLVVLARSAAARVGAAQGAAVRDDDGRTYAAASVSLPSLRLSALQLAVAQAVSSGADSLETAVFVSSSGVDEEGLVAVRELSASAVVFEVSDSRVSKLER